MTTAWKRTDFCDDYRDYQNDMTVEGGPTEQKTCGENQYSHMHWIKEGKGEGWGCGQALDVNDSYRCVDCGVIFHRKCARLHFAKSGAEKDARILRLEDEVLDLRLENLNLRKPEVSQ